MNEKEFIKNFYNLDEINLKSKQLKNLYRILNNCIKYNLFDKIDNLKQILYNAYFLNNKKHVYIADFYDSITNTIYEIKPNRILFLQKDKYNCIKESCISNGYNFIHIGDDYFNNIKIPENCDINEEIIKMFKKCIKGIKNEN